MRRYKKKNSFKFFLFVFIFVMVLGYALLSTNLNITGMVNLKHQNFSIHWVPNSIEVNDKSISQEEPILSDDNTTISYTINLKQPGDFYEFLIDATNDGTIDGMIELDGLDPVVKDENDEVIELPSYLKYSVTYSDGSDIQQYHLLEVGKTEHYKVRIEFDKNVDIDDLPDGSGQIHIDTTIPYEQSDDNAYERETLSNLTMLQTGPEVNAKLKRLAGNTEITPEMVDRALYLVNFVYKYLNSYGIIELPDEMTQEEWQEMQNAVNDIGSKITDTNVTSIEFTDTLPSEYETEDNIISTSTSKEPVYAWYDNGVIYIYSEAEEIYMNQNSSGLFNVFQNVSNINLTRFNTSKVVNMSDMFIGDGGLPRLDVSNFNTNKVTNMSYMFGVCQSMTSLDLSNFNTSKVTDMSGMFSYNQYLLDLNISSFDTSKVTDMSVMFTYDASLQSIDLSNFNTSKVTNMRSMFSNCLNLRNLDLSSFNTSNVEDMYGMFLYDQYLNDLEFGNNFNTSKVTNMKFMFGICASLTSLDLSGFDTSNVRTMYGMFTECASLQILNVKNFNTSKVEDMSGVFSGCANLTGLDLTRWNTSNTTTMYYMFTGCSNIVTLDLSSFDTSKVTNMANMFYSCDKLRTIYVSDDFITTNVTDSTNMFINSTNIVGGQGTVYDAEHIDKEYAHIDGGVDNPGYFTGKSEYCVTLDANGGTVTPSMINIVLGEEIGTLPTPTREHYSFDGWYTELIGGIKIDSTYIPTNHQIFYAHWIEDAYYIVTFNGNEGYVNEEYRKVYVGEEIGTLPSASRSGYTLEGWYTEISDGIKVESTYIPDDNIELYARWEKSKYTITFNPNGGTVSPTSKQIYQGDAIGELPIPTRTGYTFNGWYTSSSGGTKITEETIPTYNRTYYAHWTQTPKYTVTFNPNGGTVTPTSRQVYKGNEVGELPTPTRDNYTFDGWFTASSGGDEVTASTIVNATVTYYAHWTKLSGYTITFNANGGSVSPTTKDINVGDAIGELPTPTRNNYTFDGWHIDVTDYIDIDSSYIPNSDLTLYAKWYPTDKVAEINGTYYNTLQLAVNAVPTTGEPTTIRLLKSTTEKVTVASGKNATLNLRGFTVNNESDNTIIVSGTLKINDGTIACSAGKGAVDVTGTLELNNVTIEATGSRQALYNNGGTVTINNCNLTSSATQRAALHNLNNGTIYINSGTITSTNLYAIYNESGVINIGKKDGNVDITKPVIRGKTYGIVANSKYNFYDGTIKGGTYATGTATTGTTPSTAIDTNETKINEIEEYSEKVRDTEDIGGTTYKTLYLYKDDAVTITFDPNEGEVTPTTKQIANGSTIGELPIPSRPGYRFIGWYTEISDGVLVTTESVFVDDTTIYAIWEEKTTNTIILDANGGTVSSTELDIAPNTAVGVLPTPIREGYKFIGWYTELTGGILVDSTYVPQAKITKLYARWNNFPVVFKQEGACEFNGSGTITGNECTKYLDKTYIDTGIALYSNENYQKDYEIGFTIENYNPSSNPKQATFVNAKSEDSSVNWPGLVYRRETETDNLEITQTINGTKVSNSISKDDVTTVRIVRIAGVVYYAYNDGELQELQDTDGFNQQFALTTWFGASPANATGTSAQRYLNATLSNMYIKLGTYEDDESYRITFNPNGGTVSPTQKKIDIGSSVGELPTPTRASYTFDGWWTDLTSGVPVTSETVPEGNVTYYAHWTEIIDECTAFRNDSWTTILNNVDNDPTTYPVGCTKEVDLGSTYGTHTLRVANNTTPAACSTQGFSQSACGFVLEFADVITRHRMNSSVEGDTTTIGVNANGGWEYSDMRAYLNSTTYAYENIDYTSAGIYNALPSELKSKIIDTTVVSGHNMHDSTNFTTTDKLYLLSTKEVYGKEGTTNVVTTDTAEVETRQLDYYKSKGATTTNVSDVIKQNLSGANYEWWLRSANSYSADAFGVIDYGNFFFYVGKEGNHFYEFSNYTYGVSPAFRIGKTYNVTFNANDGYVSEGSRTINKGDSIGTLPTPTRPGYDFIGWYTGVTDGTEISSSMVPTGNVTYYAHWTYACEQFENDSWTTVMNNIISNPNTYPLGCEKPVDMENLGTHYLRISNTSTASGCNVSGFSQTACGVVFEFADAFDSRRMNPGPSSSQQNGEGNKGGWEYSELRSYVNSTVYNALPDVIKNRILPTSVISGHGSDDSANFVTQDKLYFLSMKEIWGVNSTEYASLPNDSVGATRQLDYYEMKGTSISDPSPASKSFSYWLRSADLNSSRFFITSSNAGVPWGSYAEYNSYISPAFRVGNKYTIDFNANGGEVSPTSKEIVAGNSIGDMPTPTRSGYTFKGWWTDLTAGVKVTTETIPDGNVTYYAHWMLKGTDFENDSWDDIIDAYEKNPSSLQQAMESGTLRELPLDLDGDGIFETTGHLRIANISTPAECSTQGFSQSACGLVIEFADIITTHRMNPYANSGNSNGDGNRGGWEYSDMRAFLNSGKYLEGETGEIDYTSTGIFNALPSELRSKIIDTKVVSGHGSNDSTNFTTTDKIYLFDPREVYGTSYTFSYDTAKDFERQLDYYKAKGVTTSNYSGAIKKNLSGSNYHWWLRSARSADSYVFFFVGSNGYWGYGSSNSTIGVSPAFRLSTGNAPVETHTNTDTTCDDNTPPTCTLNYVNVNSNGFTYSFSCTDDTQINRITSLFDHDPYNGQYNSKTFDAIGTVKSGTISNGGKTSTYTSQWTTDNSDPPDHNTCYYFSYGGEDSCGNWNVYHTSSCYQY